MSGSLHHWVYRGQRKNLGVIPWTDNGCMCITQRVARSAGDTLHSDSHQQGQFNVGRFCKGYIQLFESFGPCSQSSLHQDSDTMQTFWYSEEHHGQLQRSQLRPGLCPCMCIPRRWEGLSSPQQAFTSELYCRYPCNVKRVLWEINGDELPPQKEFPLEAVAAFVGQKRWRRIQAIVFAFRHILSWLKLARSNAATLCVISGQGFDEVA